MSVYESRSSTFKKPDENLVDVFNASMFFFSIFVFFSNRLTICFTGLTTPCTHCVRSSFESHSTRVLSRWGNLICPGPLPSAAVAGLQQLVTSSHSRLLSQKVCLFTKPQQNATLTTSAGTKPQSTDLDLAMKDESPDWDWCSENTCVGDALTGPDSNRWREKPGERRPGEQGQGETGVKPRPRLSQLQFLFDTLWYAHSRLWARGAMSRDLSDSLWDAPFVY